MGGDRFSHGRSATTLKNSEHVAQVKFVNRVRHLRHDLLLYSIPNGGLRHHTVAAQLKAEGQYAGIPDLHLARATAKYHGLYLEFKTKQGTVSKVQKKVIEKLQLEGYCVKVVRSADEAWDTMMNYLAEEL